MSLSWSTRFRKHSSKTTNLRQAVFRCDCNINSYLKNAKTLRSCTKWKLQLHLVLKLIRRVLYINNILNHSYITTHIFTHLHEFTRIYKHSNTVANIYTLELSRSQLKAKILRFVVLSGRFQRFVRDFGDLFWLQQ